MSDDVLTSERAHKINSEMVRASVWAMHGAVAALYALTHWRTSSHDPIVKMLAAEHIRASE